MRCRSAQAQHENRFQQSILSIEEKAGLTETLGELEDARDAVDVRRGRIEAPTIRDPIEAPREFRAPRAERRLFNPESVRQPSTS